MRYLNYIGLFFIVSCSDSENRISLGCGIAEFKPIQKNGCVIVNTKNNKKCSEFDFDNQSNVDDLLGKKGSTISFIDRLACTHFVEKQCVLAGDESLKKHYVIYNKSGFNLHNVTVSVTFYNSGEVYRKKGVFQNVWNQGDILEEYKIYDLEMNDGYTEKSFYLPDEIKVKINSKEGSHILNFSSALDCESIKVKTNDISWM